MGDWLAEKATQSTSSSIGEFGRLLRQDVQFTADHDYVEWWKSQGEAYPRVADYALKLVVMKATSAASGRPFSKAKRILTKQRLRMKDDTFESIVVCRENLPIVAGLLGVNVDASRTTWTLANRYGAPGMVLGELAIRMMCDDRRMRLAETS
jgi:hypothetical protein